MFWGSILTCVEVPNAYPFVNMAYTLVLQIHFACYGACLSSLSYVNLVFSTLNTRAARMHMISLDHGEHNGI